MNTEINKVSFPKISPQAVDFFNLHGWVVLENMIEREVWEEAHLAWKNHRKQCALEMGIPLENYRKEISQWRDLWTYGGVFRKILDSETSVRAIAQEGMDWTGIRLLHDHIIAKPSGTSNRKIPWHQDSMFWPVDVAGCSTWTPFTDVDIDGGCLEVIDSSHLDGCEQPVDFMAEERWGFPDNAVRVKLPVRAGSTILLHSLTWHRSGPNNSSSDRPVYISLWVHGDSKWRPDLVDWHPLNENVESEPGARLEGEMFPTWGEIELIDRPSKEIHQGTFRTTGISMFDASSILSEQMNKILGMDGNLSFLLKDQENRIFVAKKTIKMGFCQQNEFESLLLVLERLYVCHAAYVLHRARNVFNASYADWWTLAGAAWAEMEA